ncbi:hypothetical protein [Candidatus Regiella insecticola]|nr:hypothetical protein [Candidatus Regiella insecticola]
MSVDILSDSCKHPQPTTRPLKGEGYNPGARVPVKLMLCNKDIWEAIL